MGVGTNVWRLTVLGCCIIQLKDHVFEVSSVEGDSMGPTLSPTFHETGQQDAVFVTKFRKTPTKEDSPAVRSWNAEDIRRGDVVFFWSPFNNKERMGVKRVVALAGDTVMPGRRARYGAGYRDMQDDEAALNVARDLVKGRGRIGNPDVVKIPYGHVWVEGDNSERSMDSRDYGPVKAPVSSLRGCIPLTLL